MKNIYTWAAQPAQRNITVGEIIAAKGKKVLTQVTAIDITSSRYVQSSKEKFSKLTQMYLGISDHGNGGKIIIGNEIKNWKNVEINNVKITLKINDQLIEPFFTGSKRIDPKFH